MRHGPITGSLHGCLVGVVVGTLAVAAHGLAGGGYPDSARAALVLFVAASVGCAAGRLPVARDPAGVLGLLAGGQWASHWALSGLLDHGHESGVGASANPTAAALPNGWMLTAHLVATLGCAALIVLAERLYAVASSAIRVALTRPHRARNTEKARWSDPGLQPYRFHPNSAIGPRAPPVPA
ncbi:hypothetical protein ACFQZZ_12060 [Nocardia sp. GCM10030253]|uniref:hypothetical protein n=1 Tax=Nocardia sp. GCM10030253 TaxID=3273404 RepID=UPI0036267BE7